MRLDALVREWDAEGAADYNGSVSDIAAFAALIGWTRQSVNRRRS